MLLWKIYFNQTHVIELNTAVTRCYLAWSIQVMLDALMAVLGLTIYERI